MKGDIMTQFNGTPHNTAKLGEIAKTVVMPGDPLRAKFIAENFLEEPKEFNHVRGMLGYTGTYKGKRISVMGHGMGIPSMAIYSYELFKFYEVDNIIRVGSCGGYLDEMNLFDVILVEGAYSTSSFAETAYGYKEDLFKKAERSTRASFIPVTPSTTIRRSRRKNRMSALPAKWKALRCLPMRSI